MAAHETTKGDVEKNIVSEWQFRSIAEYRALTCLEILTLMRYRPETLIKAGTFLPVSVVEIHRNPTSDPRE